MLDRLRIATFDVDPKSLASLRQAFPECAIEAVEGATTKSLKADWNPGEVDLLVVGIQDQLAVTLGVCRGLRNQAGRAQIPLLVLVLPGQDALVRASLAAGAHGCLVVPVDPKEFAAQVTRVRTGNQPGRHTLGLEKAQRSDLWRDDGGEA